MNILIPSWFFGIDSAFYLLASLIGFFVSFLAYKAYSFTKVINHFYLYLSFAILGIGFLIHGIISIYTYFGITTGTLNIFAGYSSFRDFGWWIYSICSFIGYALLAFMYFPKNFKKSFPLFLPMWWKGFPYFHISSFFVLSYVIFHSFVNYFMKKTINKLLVASSFLLIGLYHLLLFFSSFSMYFYVSAHLCLLTGFLLLLYMLIRINKR
ncbi:MAG: hypothetical protein J7K26_03250 [Candidatus Aenigmarchaeota archaeon]|nr:hypothetical protein [Candidatus Aenigmarchaeota archaeon]